MKSIHLAVSAALLALTTLHANAAPSVSSGVSLSNFAVGVIDLTPSDGVAAWYQTKFDSGRAYANIASDNSPPWVVDTATTPRVASAAVSYGANSATAHAGMLEGEITTQIAADSGLEPGSLTEGAAWQSYVITVGAHTMLTVSGHASAWADKSAGSGALFDMYGSASAVLADGVLWSEYSLDTDFNGAAPAGGSSQDFWLAYANTSDTEMKVNLGFEVQTGARVRVPSVLMPVPEPSSYAMLAAGLLLTGLAARRRKLRNPD